MSDAIRVVVKPPENTMNERSVAPAFSDDSLIEDVPDVQTEAEEYETDRSCANSNSSASNVASLSHMPSSQSTPQETNFENSEEVYMPSIVVDDRVKPGIKSFPKRSSDEARLLRTALNVKKKQSGHQNQGHARERTHGMPTMKMWIRVNVFDLCSIDTKNQTFTVNLYWEVAWEAPKNFDEENEAMLALEERFDSRVHLGNLVNDASGSLYSWVEVGNADYKEFEERKMREGKEEDIQKAKENGPKQGAQMIFQRNKITGAVFRMRCDLGQFPFDTQGFDIEFRTDYPHNKVELIPNRLKPSMAKPSSFTTSNEFAVLPRIDVFLDVDQHLGSFGRIIFRLTGDRRPGFVTFNIFLPMVTISGLGLVTFVIQPQTEADRNENFERRFNVNCVLLLTQVAYKFSTSANIPEISYPTFADRVVLLAMGFQAALIVWSASLKRFPTMDQTRQADFKALVVFSFLYGAFALWLFVFAAVKWTTAGEVQDLAKCNCLAKFVHYFLPSKVREPRFPKGSAQRTPYMTIQL